LDAQRQFALRHLDIISIDAAAAFEDKDKKQRLRLFVDMCHFTVEGNRLLAEVILNKLIKKGMFKQ
jgi:phospholipase/lecithinase/hemolysin